MWVTTVVSHHTVTSMICILTLSSVLLTQWYDAIHHRLQHRYNNVTTPLQVLLSGCTSNASLVAQGKCWTPIQHGVSFNEIAKVFAMAYSWSGNASLLRASENAFQMLADYDTQVRVLLWCDYYAGVSHSITPLTYINMFCTPSIHHR